MDEDDRFLLNGIHCSFVHNWENSMDEGDAADPFESALSSMVSSPTAPGATATATANDKVVLRELIGRLGTICNGDTSCYSTPLNSPPSFLMERPPPTHLLPPFYSDPGFAQRAARLSSFATNNLESPPQLDPSSMAISGSRSTTMVAVQESRDIKSIITRLSGSSTPENVEFGDSRENSTVSDQIRSANSRKRKSNAKGKGKPKGIDANGIASENGESGAKKTKSEEEEDDINLKQSSSSSSKPPEPPKDYIHVRARRGQATDAHSLAERVRREKISDRMKLLQDLVPGCNKVTGKAVMLDEIINYVQSLQRQVEFLSMKLAVVNPRTDSKDLSSEKNNIYNPWDHSFYHLDAQSNGMVIGGGSETQARFLNQTLQLPPHPIDNFTNTTSTASQVQASAFWEDDLHSFVQMGFGQNQRQSNHASGIRMKVKL